MINEKKAIAYWDQRYVVGKDAHTQQNHQITTDFLREVVSYPEFTDVISAAGSVYEIGCGSGDMCFGIGEQFKNFRLIVGSDISSEGVEHARTRFETDVIKFECANILENLPDNRFDISLASNTIEHFKNPWLMVDAMLSFSDYAILLVPNNQPCTDGYDYEGGPGHVYTFTADEFTTRYKVHSCFTFSTPGWQHSSGGEIPLQLAVLVSRA